MDYPKQMKDIVYTLLQEPTLDNFRAFLQNQTGEHNAIDFKQEWIEKDKLAKLMLSLANYGGGTVVFGVHENENKSFSCNGLSELKPKEQVGSEVKAFISPNLKYSIYDFSYKDSEYEALKNKMFQILVVEDTPEYLPFISRKESTNIKPSAIYIRRDTSDERATEEEITKMLERRMKYMFPETGKPLLLKEHLEQLKTLYDSIKPTISRAKNAKESPLFSVLQDISTLTKGLAFGLQYETVKNPLYPEESYEEFIASLIEKKKKKIERVLDLR